METTAFPSLGQKQNSQEVQFFSQPVQKSNRQWEDQVCDSICLRLYVQVLVGAFSYQRMLYSRFCCCSACLLPMMLKGLRNENVIFSQAKQRMRPPPFPGGKLVQLKIIPAVTACYGMSCLVHKLVNADTASIYHKVMCNPSHFMSLGHMFHYQFHKKPFGKWTQLYYLG